MRDEQGDRHRRPSERKLCGCASDSFVTVPAELQPRAQKGHCLHRVKCPCCGKEYWSNKETDLCFDCANSSPG